MHDHDRRPHRRATVRARANRFPAHARADQGNAAGNQSRYVSECTAHAFLVSPPKGYPMNYLEVIRAFAEYLDMHNSKSALAGYFNDIAEELNPELIERGIAPITVFEDEDEDY
jgi:hypothetical protein